MNPENTSETPKPPEDNTPPQESQPSNESPTAPPEAPAPAVPTEQPVSQSTSEVPVGTTPPETPTVTTEQPKPPKSRKSRKLLLVVVIVIAFAIAVWGAFTVINKSSSTNGKHDVALVRIGSPEPISTGIYPNMQNDYLTSEVNNQAFEGLTKFVNNTQIAPDLATSWTNPNSTTWIFQLGHDIKFHDGNTMTSTQVAASLNKVKNYPVAESVPYTIKSATAQGKYAVKITTSQPDPVLIRELTQFWIWDTSDTKTPNSFVNGTGPYEQKPGTKETTKSAQFVAFDSYHGGKPSVRALDYQIFSSAQALVAALKQGNVDIADFSANASDAVQVKNDGYKLYNLLDPLVYYIVPNTLKPGSPIDNLKVRQAMYMVMNPTLIAKAHGGDIGSAATQLVPPEIPGYNPSVKRPAINPTAAKALLAQAGYPNGFSTSVMFDSPSQDAVATELQKELATIGIKLSFDPESDINVLGSKVESGNVDMYIEGDASVIIDTSDVASYFVIDTPEYSNPQVDALFNQAQQTFNETARLKIMQQLNATVMNDLAIFPTYTPTNQYIAYNPKLNLVLNQQYIGGVTGVYWWQTYATK